MAKLLGVLLVAAGTALLWFGGVPYRGQETLLKVGSFEARAELDKKLEVPRPVSAGLVALGTVLLLLPAGRKR